MLRLCLLPASFYEPFNDDGDAVSVDAARRLVRIASYDRDATGGKARARVPRRVFDAANHDRAILRQY